jgi:voltage-gated potassium channel Kch
MSFRSIPLIARFEETDSPDLVVIAGFGRFGQTILELLQEHAAGEFSAAVLVDRHAESLYRQFAERVGFRSGYRCDKLQADLADPGTWDRVRAIMEEPGHGTAPAKVSIVLGTDDDRLNIRTAMLLRQKLPDAQIVARCFVDSSLTRELSVDGEFEIFGVSRLLQDALAARHRRWFPS